MMKRLPFKVTSDHLLLFVFLSQLWGASNSSITSPYTTITATNTETPQTTLSTTPLTTVPTTKPTPVKDVKVLAQTDISITLMWEKAENISTYFLEYVDKGSLKVDNISASNQETSVTHVVTPLEAGKIYNFTLFTTLNGVNSTGYPFSAVTAPLNAEEFKSVGPNETSINLQWNKVGSILNYILVFDGRETNITASAAQLVTHTISNLTSATKYDFSLFTVFENVRSSGVNKTAVTAPLNVEEVKSVGPYETSINLQWNKVGSILNYILVFDGRQTNITASEAQLVTHTISNLTSATKYDFSLFTVFENVRSSGVNKTAVTAPLNAEEVKSVGPNETSINLQWNKVGSILNYILVFDGRETNITASAAQLVTHTISNLTSATKYDFSLFTVFENVRSSGVNKTAVTAPLNVEEVKSVGPYETSINLQWNKVGSILNYILVFDGRQTNITASEAQLVTHTISNLTSATKYDFSLFTVFENVRSSGVNKTAVTAPLNAEEVKSVGPNETSINLQWNKVGSILNYILVFAGRETNITASAAQLVTHTISNLTSGTKYDFSLFTVFENVRSSGVNKTAVTAPLNVEEVKSVGPNETSINLQWNKVGSILNYILVFDGRETNITASAAQLVTHTISNLTSATKYDFSLFTVFENVRSSGVNKTAVTAPENVKNVTVLTQSNSSITLMWDKVNSIPTYILQYGNNSDPVESKSDASHQKASITHEVSSLKAGTKYDFTLTTVFEKVYSIGFSFNAVTVPSAVDSVSVTTRSVTSVTLEWKNMDKNWSYILQIDKRNISVDSNGSFNAISSSVPSLLPGTKYPFSVITTFSDLSSPAFTDFTLTTINCTNVTWHVTNSSIHGMVKGLFSKATATNGSEVKHVSPGGSNVSFTGLYSGATYMVLLEYEHNYRQCDHILTISPPDLTARCENWAAGYAILIVWDKPDGVWTAVEVNVTGKTYIVDTAETQDIKIAGFQPAKTYEVSLASLSGTVRTRKPYVFQCRTDPRGVIAGSVIAILLCVLVCLALFIVFKRPDIISRRKPFIGDSRLSNNKCKPIYVAKFPDHFYQLTTDENRGFSEEYENLLPVGTEQTRKVALLPENKAKNRFNNVLPYDWCRVKLNTSNHDGISDYINASYMPGYNSNREYIATQGPLPATVNDFWRMIWEQRVKGIVMVTNCTEGGRTKCEQYWPADSKTLPHGELLVTIRSEQQESNWTLREFRVKHRNTSEDRTVKHFHFTAWPDHGVPQGTEVLIQFRELVRRHIQREGTGEPTVVHCSAGVGRTGTIIALDVLLQQLERERAVGINAFVHKMRLNRPHMVQTESQYVFLHQCIMDCLQPNERIEDNIYENTDSIYVNATALRELR